MVLYKVFLGLDYFIRILSYALLIYCVLTWILPPYHKVMHLFARFVDPMLRPIRKLLFRLLPRMPIDFSPIAASLILQFASRLLWRIYLWIA